jgi:hypothetical protein
VALAEKIAAVAGVSLLALAALALSLMAHLETDVGLRAAEHAIEWQASHASRGEVRIGRVRSLPPGRLSLLDYRITAPNGEVVIAADEIAGMLEPRGLLDGQIRFRPSWFVRSKIRLTPGPGGQINLVYASEVPEERSSMPLVFEDIRLIDNEIFVGLPGKPAVTMRKVYGLADLHIGHFWQWRLSNNRGEVDLRPFTHPGFREMNGRVRSDHAHPLVVTMVLDIEIAEPDVTLDYYVPALAGAEGEPYFELNLGEREGVGQSEQEEEAREAVAEARAELEGTIREEREERAEGDIGEADELRAAIPGLRRALRETEQRSGGGERRGRASDEQGVRRGRETRSEDEEENVRALSKRRPDREEIAERERRGEREGREQRREEREERTERAREGGAS